MGNYSPECPIYFTYLSSFSSAILDWMAESMFISSNIPIKEKNMERKVICFYIDL